MGGKDTFCSFKETACRTGHKMERPPLSQAERAPGSYAYAQDVTCA